MDFDNIPDNELPQGWFAPRLEDMPRIMGYIEVVAFDINRAMYVDAFAPFVEREDFN